MESLKHKNILDSNKDSKEEIIKKRKKLIYFISITGFIGMLTIFFYSKTNSISTGLLLLFVILPMTITQIILVIIIKNKKLRIMWLNIILLIVSILSLNILYWLLKYCFHIDICLWW